MPSTKGRDYQYIAPGADARGTRISRIILDQPEIFLSPDSPYAGAKPADLAAIADALRSTAAAALQDFMDKFDILDRALQIEVQDSVKQDVLGAAVIRRGQSADATKRIEFEALVAVMNEYAERYNAHVGAAKCIDCLDPVARKARPPVVGK
jgi:hypothetical protein